MEERKPEMHPSAVGAWLFDEQSSDMTFLVDGHRVPAHKHVIMSSCEYLRVLLEGIPRKSIRNEIVLVGVPLRGFKLLLSSFYGEELRLHEFSSELMSELIEIVQMFELTELEAQIHRFVQTGLSIGSVSEIYRVAEREQLKDIAEICQTPIIENAKAALEDEGFCLLSESALCQTLSQDTFCAEEIEIFQAVCRWCSRREVGYNFSNVFEVIRLELMDRKHLLSIVKDSGWFSADRISDAVATRKSKRCKNMRFRGHRIKNVNLASLGFGAMFMIGRVRRGCVEAATKLNHESHKLSSTLVIHENTGLIVRLDKPYFINRIEVKLPRGLGHGANVFVRTAPSLAFWRAVGSFDTSKKFIFEPRVVRYIELIHRTGLSVPLTSLRVCFQASERHGESYRVPPGQLRMGPPLSPDEVLGSGR